MLLRNLLLSASIALMAGSSFAQTADQFVTWGDNAVILGDHYGASKYYAAALDKEPGKLEVQWKCAEAYRLSNQYPEAAALYEKVQKKDLRKTHKETQRWIAEMWMCAGAYDDAEKAWRKALLVYKDTASTENKRARNGLLGCGLARRVMQRPDSALIDHLPEPVNSYSSEFAPRPDSTTLYFTSLRGETNDDEEVIDTAAYRVQVFTTTFGTAGWSEPVALSEMVNGPGDNANSAWSTDRKWYYFTRCTPDGKCAIHACSFINGRLGEPQLIPGLSEECNTTQPMVIRATTVDRLYYSSDGEGGEGGMDIWVCEITGTAILNARALHAPVNTPGNETCPYYLRDEKKLYFSSDFHPGLGGYDIFTSEDNGRTFTTPENVGYPLNSPANDLYPVFDPATRTGWFTSNRTGSLAKKGKTCCNDLYRFTYPKPEPVIDTTPPPDTTVAMKRIISLREKLPITLYFHNDEPNPRSWDTVTVLNYEETYRAYKALVPDYHSAWKGNEKGIGLVNGFFRDRVDHGFDQLNQFIALLKEALDEGQRIELQVRGFASPLAKTDYNEHLSLRRIQSMINYLRVVNDGAFIPYLDGTAENGGRLTIRKSPFGENTSASGVSDELQDLKNSVYSVGASLERRIEIEQVLLAPEEAVRVPDAKPRDLRQGTMAQNIGEVLEGEARDIVFKLKNGGKEPVMLVSSKADCGCTTAILSGTAIEPGSTQDVIVHFNGRAPVGDLKRTVTITTNGEPRTLSLIIHGTIIPQP